MKTLKYIKINPKSVYESRLIVQGNLNPLSPSISITRKIDHPLSRYSINNLNQSNSTSFSMLNSFRSHKEKIIDKSLGSIMIQPSQKVLVLDLDETLIHSTQEKIPKTIPNYTLFISFDSVQSKQKIYVYVRPYLNEFLEKMAKKYELMIFTASQPSYANSIIDLIDPNRRIGLRFFRTHCRLINGSLIKDLTIVNRNLNSVIMLDNSPFTYSLQNDNGIPIPSWTGNNRDSELFKLINLLEYLSEVNDVRDYLRLFIDNDQVNYVKYLSYIQKKTLIPEQSKDQIDEYSNRNIKREKQLNNNEINQTIFASNFSLPFNTTIKSSLLKCKMKLMNFSLTSLNNRSLIHKSKDQSPSSLIIKLPLMKYKSKSTSNLHNNEENCFLQEAQEGDLPILKRSRSKLASKKDLFSYKLRKYTDQRQKLYQY